VVPSSAAWASPSKVVAGGSLISCRSSPKRKPRLPHPPQF
jgi:hypothetical protein